MHSHLVGLNLLLFFWGFLLFHILCMQTVKALARMQGCAGWPKSLLVAYMLSTFSTWAWPIIWTLNPFPYLVSQVSYLSERTCAGTLVWRIWYKHRLMLKNIENIDFNILFSVVGQCPTSWNKLHSYRVQQEMYLYILWITRASARRGTNTLGRHHYLMYQNNISLWHLPLR